MRKRTLYWLLGSAALLVVSIVLFGFIYLNENNKADLSANGIQSEWLKAQPDINLLKSGDLIFRKGRGFISNSLVLFSHQDKRYSHSGIISFDHGKPYVLHSIGGEDNISKKLRKESLASFCNPNANHCFGIYRLDLNAQQSRKLDSIANYYYKTGLEFDTDFDLATDNKMYCTEFIYKSLFAVNHDKNYIPLSIVSGKTYVACDNLYLNPHATKIYYFEY